MEFAVSGNGVKAVQIQTEVRATIGQLAVEVHRDDDSLGRSAAHRLAAALRAAVDERGSARLIAATGNSQFPLMAALSDQDIPWQQVTVFHMDEYVGVTAYHPASFRRWIRRRIEQPFTPAKVEYIAGDASDLDAEILRYETALRAAPIDVVCMGIGENGHLAFNEPQVADFDDPRWVRTIDLTETSRMQQVGEGHFATIDEVPTSAITLTIPALLSARTVIVSAPERRKATAVARALTGPVSADCPASILQRTPQAVLLLDLKSAALVTPIADVADRDRS